LTAANQTSSPEQTHAEVISLHKIPENDGALVAAVREGRRGAAHALVDRYGGFVQGLLLKVVGFDPEVPDLMQDVLLSALQRIGELREPDALKAWLGSITVFTARAFLRKRRFRRRLVWSMPPESLPEGSVHPPNLEANQILRRTYKALDELPADERIAFSLRFMEGMTLGEAAALCGVSLATIKRRIKRGEERFLAAARRDPILEERLEQGGRWRDR